MIEKKYNKDTQKSPAKDPTVPGKYLTFPSPPNVTINEIILFFIS